MPVWKVWLRKPYSLTDSRRRSSPALALSRSCPTVHVWVMDRMAELTTETLNGWQLMLKSGRVRRNPLIRSHSRDRQTRPPNIVIRPSSARQRGPRGRGLLGSAATGAANVPPTRPRSAWQGCRGLDDCQDYHVDAVVHSCYVSVVEVDAGLGSEVGRYWHVLDRHRQLLVRG